MDVNNSRTDAETQEILSTLQQIQDSAELRAEAGTNPEGVLNRFNLSAIARSAVALGIAGLLVAPTIVATPDSFWN